MGNNGDLFLDESSGIKLDKSSNVQWGFNVFCINNKLKKMYAQILGHTLKNT